MLLFPALATAMLLAGCSNSPTLEEETERADNAESYASELQTNIDALDSQIEDIRVQLDSLERAHSDLDSAIQRFDSEDWAFVVPSVQTAESDVENEISNLRQEVER